MISEASLRWSLQFLSAHGDGDLFPKIPEIDAISSDPTDFIATVIGKQLSDLPAGPCRRFLVPKDDFSYRQATQLDPQDSIIFCALIYEYGAEIERRRLAADTIFSYRFRPTLVDGLYGEKESWNKFWESAYRKANSFPLVLYCDIADFYNQIYHHTIENQLIASSFPNQVTKWLIGLFESTTAGVSRGVPIGPHATHLIAESTLIPIDNSLRAQGVDFLRYADDILVFCSSEQEARATLGKIATTLDQQQRLMLQRHKTKLFNQVDFRALCHEMVQDRPISDEEDRLLKIIKRYSGGNPYKVITYNSISASDWAQFSQAALEQVITEYLNQTPIDFIRLRWFYRRLAQVGHPGAIDISLRNIEKLGPCLSNICTYLASVQFIDQQDWLRLGERLLGLLNLPEIAQQPYFRLSVLSLFSKTPHMNHFSKLAESYSASDAFAQREILLAAKANGAVDWLREHKESFQHMDPWRKSAFIYSASEFPRDEKKFFLNRHSLYRPFDQSLAKWSKAV